MRIRNGREETVSSSDLRKGDIVLVRESETIPGDGEVIEGVAYVNEAAITGESAPVLKEPGTDIRSSVTGGTQVVSDWLDDPDHRRSRRDLPRPDDRAGRGRRAPEDAQRDRAVDPAGGADDRLLAGRGYAAAVRDLRRPPVSTVILIALLVCLIPTTIGGLLSAIGIAGMDRVTRFNVLAMSGRAVEAAGDVDVLLLDKTGTITFGNRLAAEIIPVGGASRLDALIAARQSSLGDDTPEGRSILAPGRAAGRAADRRPGLERRAHPVPRRDAHERPAPGRPRLLQGRRRRDPRRRERQRQSPARHRRARRAHLARGRHAAGADDGRARRRRRLPERHRQARHARAVRRVPPHGHQHHHDHRRQPADRRDHRERSRRRRLRRRRRSPRTRSGSSASSRPKATWWR